MHEPDPKTFYNKIMPKKVGNDYEDARWHAGPLLSAQYVMMTDVLNRLVAPNARHARRVLEVGPGPGTWTKLLLEANAVAQYTLVDISREMLAQARGALAGRTNITFAESDFLKFEIPPLFDFFFSSRAIEYMPDKRAAVKKIASLLLPGGQGAIVTKMPKPFFDRMRGRDSRALHDAQIRPSTLTRLLRNNGLIVEKIRIATTTIPTIGSAPLNEFAYQLLKHLPLSLPLTFFTESYVVIFKKPL